MLKRRRGLLALFCTAAVIAVGAWAKSGPPAVHFMGKTYRLASFHAKDQATWQFYLEGETADNWTTMFTIVDRPEAQSGKEIDKLADDVKADYAAHGGKVFVTQKNQDVNGDYTYVVVGYDSPAKQTYELQFVKIGKKFRNGYVASYGVRITDPKDYAAKTKAFLHGQSIEIAKALAEVSLPDIGKLPRTEQ
ncbi:MAG TPA: hypothetical protein VMJ34_09125 [Bryobacteraceae bacterium]|nr:hypothetical protein [Bryobacteraceae bacterium]